MLFQLIETLHAKGVNEIDGLVAGTNGDTKGEFNQSKLERKKLYPKNHLEGIPSDGVPFVAMRQLDLTRKGFRRSFDTKTLLVP